MSNYENLYPNCFECANAKIKMPFGELKCKIGEGDNHPETVIDSEGTLFIGGKTLTSGKIVPCKQWKLRKGEIETEPEVPEDWSNLDEGLKGVK